MACDDRERTTRNRTAREEKRTVALGVFRRVKLPARIKRSRITSHARDTPQETLDLEIGGCPEGTSLVRTKASGSGGGGGVTSPRKKRQKLTDRISPEGPKSGEGSLSQPQEVQKTTSPVKAKAKTGPSSEDNKKPTSPVKVKSKTCPPF
ncbi:hypothetical protein L1987_54773 [Smallanthus sonchifolius]|uniref:Uncharacterized protein n=1 Tax=Smallanthus sonchifolius TaxID=185202 RepID=A0ACB9E855_9ASTR|nr:hypothetical protein L1987_54773 [Smallanthus sonchifolius]